MAMKLPVLDRDKQETMPLVSGKEPGTQTAFPAGMPVARTNGAQSQKTAQTTQTTKYPAGMPVAGAKGAQNQKTAQTTQTKYPAGMPVAGTKETQSLKTVGKMPTLANRAEDVVSSVFKSTGAAFSNAGGVLLDTARHLDTLNSQEYRKSVQEAENAAHYREMLSRGTLDDGTVLDAAGKQRLEMLAQRAEQRAGIYREGAEATHAPISRVISDVYGTADELADSAAQDLADAKEGAGAVGSFLVDAGAAGVQLAGDIGLVALTGGSAMPVVAARTFGSSTQKARQEGADLGQQLAYGTASAALSVATEKISNVASPFRKAFGAGAADKLAGRLVSRFGESTAVQTMQKLSQTAMGKIAASAIGEGSEEFVEDVFQPVLQRATYDPDARFDLSDALRDAAIGAVLGGVGGAVDVGMGRVQGKENAAPETEAAESVKQGTPDPADVDLVARVLNGGTETGPVQAGRVTVIQKPYQGKTPVQTQKSTAAVTVDSGSVQAAQNLINGSYGPEGAALEKSFKATLKNAYKAVFKPSKNVPVSGVTFDGRPYTVDIPGSVPGKVISDPNLTAEKLALLDILPQVVQNGEYVGSGQYVQHGSKQKNTVRYDYFETLAKINGRSYMVSFDVEVFPDVNNYRTHKLNEIELFPATDADTGRDPAAGGQETAPVEGTRPLNSDFTIPQGAESVKQGAPDPADVDLVARILSGGEETGTLQSKENTTPVSGTAVNENGLTALTDQEKINLSSGKRNKIISTFSDAVSFIRNALANKSNVDRAYLGKVPDDVAQRVYHDTGVNIRGYTAVLHGDSVRHMFKNHGDTAKESARGQIALTPEAAANIPQVLSAPDRVLLSGNTDVRGLPTLLFEKEIGDYYISAQAVADGTHSIQTDTLYIRKKKNPQDTVSNTNNTAGPEHNVRNVPPQGSSIDLTSAEGSLAGPAPAASSETSSPVEGTRPLNSDFTIPQGTESVNEGQAAKRGTGALDQLGVRIRGDQGDYDASAWIRGREEARRQTERARRQAEKRLNPTKGEKRFAHGIAEGDYTAADIPASMDRAAVAELAEYYAAEESFKGTDSVKQRSQEIRQENEDLARELLGEPEDYRPMPMLVVNERTPERVMRRLFGEERGEAINQAYIYPVQQNEAEKIRFTNRMLDAVRTFQDSAGRETPLTKQERSLVQQVLEDRFVGETVASMETAQGIRNAAENIRMGKDAGDAAREFGLGAQERELAQRLSRWMENQELLESGQVDSVKIQNAVETYARQYDRFYDAINDFLTAHGYGTIGFIKGYAPHMQAETTQTKLSAALSALGVNPDAMQLPTSISGLTADYKPGKRWNRFFLTRRGSSTDNDVAKGYETYVSHLADVLYHTDDIARLRGLSRYLRKTYGGEEISNAIDHAEGLRTLDSTAQLEALRDAGLIEKGSVLTSRDTRAKLEEHIDKLYKDVSHMTRYGEFVKYIDNYANILAGKQSMADRGLEYTAGRSSLNAGNRLVSAFARAQVAGNVSSALNQSAQLAQLLAEVDRRSVAGAAADLARATGGRLWNIRAAELFDQSDLLTTKKGIEYLTAKDKPLDQYVTMFFKPAETMDSLISALTVQSKYRQLRSRGMEHAAAMEEANRFATSIMASRAKGSKPLAYESKSLFSQMLHMFQVEAVNSWEHISQDLPRQYRKVAAEHGKAAAGRAVATVAVKGLLSAFLLNRITEAAYGGTPAPFDLLGYVANFVASGKGMSTNAWLADLLNSGWEKLFGEPLFDGGDNDNEEDEPFAWERAKDDLKYNLSNDIPFLRNAAGLLGWGDQTMPLANIAEAVQGVGQAADNSGILSGEMGGALLALGGSMVPGGRQAQKTVQGVQTILNGGRMYGYGDNQRLQYPVERDPTNIVQAVLFGNSGLSESRDFYASGDTGLSAKQTQLVKDLDASGADRSEVYEAIQGIRAGESEQAKVQALARASLSDREKLRIYTESIAGSGSTRADTMRELVAMGVSWEKIAETFPFGAGAAAQERYADYVGLGFSPETAGGLAGALDALEPEEGKESVSSLQKYRTVVDYGLSEAEQMTVLREMMEDAEYENLADAYRQGVTPEQFVSFREGVSGLSADKGPRGKTISGSLKRKVMQFIDSMELSNAQKTALYYAAGYAQSTLDDAPWYGRPEYDPWNIIPRLDG